MRVLVTGASGRIAPAVREELGDRDEYEFTYLDVAEHEEHETYLADVTEYDDIRPAFDGQDAVVHFAYIRGPEISSQNRDIVWSDSFVDNLRGTHNVVKAALDAGLEKFVYASSNHAVGMYEVENAPEIYYPGFDLSIDHTVPIRPDSMYGLTKAHGEGLGRFAAEQHGLRCYALRIGAVRENRYDHPYGDAERGVDEGRWDRGSDEYDEQVARMKGMWQSRRDLAQLIDRCLRDDTVEFDVFYGVSESDRSWFSIDHAREVLGYDPQDDAEAWDGPSE